MQENNMSVFGTVIRNEEIADFMRLLNLAREIFKQELTVVEIMPGGLTNKNFRAVTEDGRPLARQEPERVRPDRRRQHRQRRPPGSERARRHDLELDHQLQPRPWRLRPQ